MNFLEILIFLPTFGAFIGWVCKLMAIRMLFAPSKFVGIGPIGWQGVVQRRAPKFASGVADTVEHAGIDVGLLVHGIDGHQVAEELAPVLATEAESLLETIVETVKPGGFAEMAPEAREQIAEQLVNETKRVAGVAFEELKPDIAKAIDIRALIISQLSGDNADRLAVLFQRIARNELRIVILYGAVLGFFIGLLEVGFYAVLEKWWLLPIIGAIDGLVNNWLAIQMIFRPYEKTYYLGIFPFQGLFPARQHEISGEYGEMMAHDVLAPRVLLESIWEKNGPELAQKARTIVERELAPMMGLVPMLLGVEMSPEHNDKILEAIIRKLPDLEKKHEADVTRILREKLGIDAQLEQALKKLPKEEFESVLRGIFEADEWILISLGGVLGGLIGLAQGAFVLAIE